MGGKGTAIRVVMLLLCAAIGLGAIECNTVGSLMATCSNFLTFGSPDPTVDTPCCDALSGLNTMADSTSNRQDLCRCLAELISKYNPNATAVARLPSICNIYLGVLVQPNINCNNIP